MIKDRRIDSRQIIVMAVLSRLFLLLIYVPEKSQELSGGVSAVKIILGMLLSIVAMLPAYFLLKKLPGMDISDATALLAPKLYRPVAFLFYIICILVAAVTIGAFEFFMTSTVYPQANHLFVLLIFSAAVIYMIYMGIEAISRASLIIIALILFSGILVVFGVWNKIELLNFHSPLEAELDVMLPQIFGFLGQNVELILFSMLIPYVRSPKIGKNFLTYSLAVFLMLQSINFIVGSVLGGYAATKTFPVYTVFSISGSQVFYRMDYFHVAGWVAMSLVRASIYLLMACRMMRIFMPKLKQSYIVNTTIASLIAILCSTKIQWFKNLSNIISNSGAVYILLILLPVILLFLLYSKKDTPAIKSIFYQYDSQSANDKNTNDSSGGELNE